MNALNVSLAGFWIFTVGVATGAVMFTLFADRRELRERQERERIEREMRAELNRILEGNLS